MINRSAKEKRLEIRIYVSVRDKTYQKIPDNKKVNSLIHELIADQVVGRGNGSPSLGPVVGLRDRPASSELR